MGSFVTTRQMVAQEPLVSNIDFWSLSTSKMVPAHWEGLEFNQDALDVWSLC